MSLKYVLLVTEGHHDQAAIGQLLRLYDFVRFRGESNLLDPFWAGFKRDYPKNGNLYTRMDMPSIFTSSTHSVAIYVGGGSELTRNLTGTLKAYPQYAHDIHSFGLIVDADREQPKQIAKTYADNLRQFYPTISDAPGVISEGTPRTGIYVLPDNKQSGVLDTILVNCASVVYPDHKDGAEQFLNGLKPTHVSHWQPFDHQKAVVASIVSVLKPGMTNTSSIAQDRWFCEQTVNDVAEVATLKQFIENLLELTAREPVTVPEPDL